MRAAAPGLSPLLPTAPLLLNPSLLLLNR